MRRGSRGNRRDIREVSRNISEVVTSMQFQDITRQQF